MTGLICKIRDLAYGMQEMSYPENFLELQKTLWRVFSSRAERETERGRGGRERERERGREREGEREKRERERERERELVSVSGDLQRKQN
jgi:hypothetical protein